MNTSPKQRFLEQKAMAQQMLDIVDSEVFTRASELAMLAFLDELNMANVNDAAANYFRIDGARRFLQILKALPEPPKPTAARPNYNIDHNLK